MAGPDDSKAATVKWLLHDDEARAVMERVNIKYTLDAQS